MTDLPLVPFDKNHYERPNQPWGCGHLAHGDLCPLGPTHKGECRQARYECVPSQQGDRWRCSRSRKHGGPCDEGPSSAGVCSLAVPPCRPVRSILQKRKMVSLCTFGLALGFVLIVCSLHNRTAYISPGPRASVHASLEKNCAACHHVGDATPGVWLRTALTSHDKDTQSALCIKCHDEFGEHALFAHNSDPHDLERVTRRITNGNPPVEEPWLIQSARTVMPAPGSHGSQLACAVCHHEHRGEDFDLTRMTNEQCQVCHANTFHSFSGNHPDLSHYPYERRTRLYFNHKTHYDVHFSNYERIMPGGLAPLDRQGKVRLSTESCLHCHQPDATKSTMLFRGYDTSCSSCHDRQITEGAIPIVEQPPGRSTPFMKYLLELDPELQKNNDWFAQPLGNAERELAWHHLVDTLSETKLTAPEKLDFATLLLAVRTGTPPAGKDKGWHKRPPKNAMQTIAYEYAPQRHADPFLRSWLDSSAKLVSGPDWIEGKEPIDQVFAELADYTAPGRCMKCHTADRQPDGSLRINWYAYRHMGQGFTKFSHAPHTTLMGKESCVRCHQLEDRVELFLPEFLQKDTTIQTDPACPETSGFRSMQKQSCASCHNANATRDNCLTCHNYHITSHSHPTSGRFP